MGSPSVLLTFQVKPTPLIRWALRMPFIDRTKMPLLTSSICIFVAHAHLLLPAPLLWCRSPSLLIRHARGVDWLIYRIQKTVSHLTSICEVECIPHSLSVIWSSPRLVFLSHLVCGSDVEPLQPRHYGLCEVPFLVAIKEDRLHEFSSL